jgi:hypothetical protein
MSAVMSWLREGGAPVYVLVALASTTLGLSIVALTQRSRPLAWAALAAAITVFFAGLLGTVFGLRHAFAAVSGVGVTAEMKQRILARGISEAMNCTALAIAADAVCLVLIVAGFLRSRAAPPR